MYTSVLLGIKSAYILKCMYICTSGRNNGLWEEWVVGIMGRQNY